MSPAPVGKQSLQSAIDCETWLLKFYIAFGVWHKRTLAPKKIVYLFEQRRVSKGIAAQASHRTVREALTSYGSYHIIKRI
jgi:hypothetical protein